MFLKPPVSLMGCLFVWRSFSKFFAPISVTKSSGGRGGGLLRARGIHYLLCCELTQDMFKNACHSVLQYDPQVEYSPASHQYIYFFLRFYLPFASKQDTVSRKISVFINISERIPNPSFCPRFCVNVRTQ